MKVKELRAALKGCDQKAEVIVRIPDEDDPDDPRGADEDPEDFLGFVISTTPQADPGPYLILEVEPADDEDAPEVDEREEEDGDDEPEASK